MVTWEGSAGWIDSSQTESSTFRGPVTKAAGKQCEDVFPIIFRATLSYDKHTSNRIWIILNLCLWKEKDVQFVAGLYVFLFQGHWYINCHWNTTLFYLWLKLISVEKAWILIKIRWKAQLCPSRFLTSPAAKKNKCKTLEKRLHLCHLLGHTPHKIM